MSAEHSSMRRRDAAAGGAFVRIPQAVERSGLSRGSLYKLATQHRGLFRKFGSATVVDLARLDSIMSELPAAEINIAD